MTVIERELILTWWYEAMSTPVESSLSSLSSGITSRLYISVLHQLWSLQITHHHHLLKTRDPAVLRWQWPTVNGVPSLLNSVAESLHRVSCHTGEIEQDMELILGVLVLVRVQYNTIQLLTLRSSGPALVHVESKLGNVLRGGSLSTWTRLLRSSQSSNRI